MATKRKVAKKNEGFEEVESMPLPPQEEPDVVASPIYQPSYEERPLTPPVRSSSTRRIGRKTKRAAIIALVIILVFLGTARIFHWWNWGLSTQEIQQREAAAVIAKVSAIILLPDETPTLATVANASALKASQAFYANADNGDILLVFPHAEEAILYRPSENKIINIAPVTVNQNQTPAKSTSTPSSKK